MIRCPSCCACLGYYEEFIMHARHALYMNLLFEKGAPHMDIDPHKVDFKPGLAPPLEPIFDALNITNRCCRLHITTRKEVDEIYKAF